MWRERVKKEKWTGAHLLISLKILSSDRNKKEMGPLTGCKVATELKNQKAEFEISPFGRTRNQAK